MDTCSKDRIAKRISDKRWQVALEGRPPAVVCASFEEAVHVAARVALQHGIDLPTILTDTDVAEVPAADVLEHLDHFRRAQDHVKELLALGMTRTHIAQTAGITTSVLDLVAAGASDVSETTADAVLGVEFELSDTEAYAIDIEHFMAMGGSITEAVRWCAAQHRKHPKKLSNAARLVVMRSKGAA